MKKHPLMDEYPGTVVGVVRKSHLREDLAPVLKFLAAEKEFPEGREVKCLHPDTKETMYLGTVQSVAQFGAEHVDPEWQHVTVVVETDCGKTAHWRPSNLEVCNA
jgi:hypothetical protein